MQLNFTPFPTLTTERLVLRAIDINDDKELFILRSDDEVNKYVGNPKPKSLTDIHKLIEILQKNAAENLAILWAISYKDDAKLIGTICYWNISTENETVELGYMLTPQEQGKGVMHEALVAILDYCSTHIQPKSIEAFMHKDNNRSARLLERNGFSRDSVLEEKHKGEKGMENMVVYSLKNK